MADWAVRVEGLSKRFVVGHRPRALTLRESIAEWATAPIEWVNRRIRRNSEAAKSEVPRDELWAVKNVSVEIQRGEVVGIIGRNGSGKSTFLKLLARILEPDSGRAILRGQLGALLEVGTGFHPELTGRENIFLSGAILGMRHSEIVRKFDEIVDFAETERFLDMPVKHYSSGMYMRLAFAVAAHFEPDILIIDEVLAVGDERFQKKCLNVMEKVSHQGRTILFVSHNMSAVARLCPRTMLFEQGKLVADGPSLEAIHRYQDGAGSSALAERIWKDEATAPGNDIARLRAVRVRDQQGRLAARIDIRSAVSIEIEYDVLTPGYLIVPNFHLVNDVGVTILVALDSSPGAQDRPRSCGRHRCAARIPGNLLAEGIHGVLAALSTFQPSIVHAVVPEVVSFTVVDSFQGDSARGTFTGYLPGVVRPLLHWESEIADQREAA